MFFFKRINRKLLTKTFFFLSLSLYFFSYFLFCTETAKVIGVACPTLTLEIEMIPTSQLASRVSATNCPAQKFPTLDFSSLNSQNTFSYDSNINDNGVVFNVQDSASTSINFLQKYTFILPTVSVSDKWVVEAVLGNHFLTGGSLGLLLQVAGSPATNLSCVGVRIIYLFINTKNYMKSAGGGVCVCVCGGGQRVNR